MKKLLFLICLPFMSLCADETPRELKNIDDRYGYFTYGFGLPGIFGLNIGMRSQHNKHGFEYGVGVVPLVFVYEYHAFASYLYYPKPSLDSQFYFGTGLRGGYANITGKKMKKGAAILSPGFIFGKSYRTAESIMRFYQVAVSPVSFVKKDFQFAPSINVSYGYCF